VSKIHPIVYQVDTKEGPKEAEWNKSQGVTSLIFKRVSLGSNDPPGSPYDELHRRMNPHAPPVNAPINN